MKKGNPGKARFVRRIPISGFASPAKPGKGKSEDNGKRETLRLTVRGLFHGAVRMEADDGSVLTCAKENARGTLWGDVVEAERIGRERVRVRRVLTRAHEEIVGVLHEKQGVRYILPLERRLPQGIAVRPGGEEAHDGDVVHTKVVRWEDEGGLLVRIDGVLGSFGEARAALDALIVSQHLRTTFDEDALRELAGGRTIDCVIVDPSAASFIEVLRRKGWRVKKAKNDVLSGIRLTSDCLKTGKIVICETCADCVRELGEYLWEPGGGKDRVRKEHDHAMDDMRYFVSTVLGERSGGFAACSVVRTAKP